MAIYKVTMRSGDELWMQADFDRASAPLSVCFGGDDRWSETRHTTADAKNYRHRAAQMLYDQFDGNCNQDEVVEVVIIEGSKS